MNEALIFAVGFLLGAVFGVMGLTVVCLAAWIKDNGGKP